MKNLLISSFLLFLSGLAYSECYMDDGNWYPEGARYQDYICQNGEWVFSQETHKEEFYYCDFPSDSGSFERVAVRAYNTQQAYTIARGTYTYHSKCPSFTCMIRCYLRR